MVASYVYILYRHIIYHHYGLSVSREYKSTQQITILIVTNRTKESKSQLDDNTDSKYTENMMVTQRASADAGVKHLNVRIYVTLLCKEKLQN